MLSLVCGAARLGHAEDPYQVTWSRQIGTASADTGSAVAVDASGNVYFTGSTSGSLAGPNAGSRDIFLAKYDATGGLIWSQQLGSSGNDDSRSLAIDSDGYVYLGGSTTGSLFAPNSSGPKAFLVKFDPAGNQLWSRQLGDDDDIDAPGSAVAVDVGGNAYLAGHTSGELFQPVFFATDPFLVKYDGSGNVLWSKQITTHLWQQDVSLAVDGGGNSYLTGWESNGIGPFERDLYDTWLQKLDSSGQSVWSREIPHSTMYDQPSGVAVDGDGNIYVAGINYVETGFPPSPFNPDGFLSKYNNSGDLLWTRQFGGTFFDGFSALTLDAAGNAYVSGQTEIAFQQIVAVVAKYDPSGALLWSKEMGAMINFDSAMAYGSGSAHLAGTTPGNVGGPNAGGFDAFVLKLTPVPEPTAKLLTLFALAIVAVFSRNLRRMPSTID